MLIKPALQYLFSDMCKNILITSFLLIALNITVSSQSYFSKRYDINNASLWSYSQNIIENKAGYFLNFVTTGISPQNRRIGFLPLDFNGNITGPVKIYAELDCSIETGCPGSFIKLSDDSL